MPNKYLNVDAINVDDIEPIRRGVPHDDLCERRDNEREAAALPHTTVEDADASFWRAVGEGWIDSNGNVLCFCASRAAVDQALL